MGVWMLLKMVRVFMRVVWVIWVGFWMRMVGWVWFWFGMRLLEEQMIIVMFWRMSWYCSDGCRMSQMSQVAWSKCWIRIRMWLNWRRNEHYASHFWMFCVNCRMSWKVTNMFLK
jgi:hypothetical protein